MGKKSLAVHFFQLFRQAQQHQVGDKQRNALIDQVGGQAGPEAGAHQVLPGRQQGSHRDVQAAALNAAVHDHTDRGAQGGIEHGHKEQADGEMIPLFKFAVAHHKAHDQRGGHVAQAKQGVQQVAADQRGDKAAEQAGYSPYPRAHDRRQDGGADGVHVQGQF